MRYTKRILPILIATAFTTNSALSLATDGSERENTPISVASQQSSPEKIKKYKTLAQEAIKCPLVKSDELEIHYKENSNSKWDITKMGCSIGYGNSLSEAGFFNFLDVEQQLSILGSHIEYFDALHKSYPKLHASPAITIELDLRWQKNHKEGYEIISRLEPYWWWLNEFKLLSTTFKLAGTQHLTEYKESIKQSQKAIKILNTILEEEPDVLDSLTNLLLGQLLLSLPEFSGGDPIRAVSVLEKGAEQSPDNLTILRWLIDAYVAEQASESAVKTLEKAAFVSSKFLHPQDHVDTLKELTGFAISLNQKELARYFKQKRNLILKLNPQLLPREESAELGHGGADPITGKFADEI